MAEAFIRVPVIWQPTLVPGCYDAVLDVNGDCVFNVETDLTCKFILGIPNVIPEVPFDVAIASLSMIGAAVGLAGFKRFRVAA
jgi:hypothetical protein